METLQMRCGSCGEERPREAFSPSIFAKGSGRCRDCARAAQREARARDPERFRGYRKDFVARSPAAARASAAKWTARKKAEYLSRGPSRESIRCPACATTKPVSHFTPAVAARGSGTCRACLQVAKRDYERRNREKSNAAARLRRARQPERARERARAHYEVNRAAYRNSNLKGRYGITSEQYDALLASQGGGCACCGARGNSNGKKLFVDHDHETGAVRGILCHKCNVGIGALGDDIAGVRRALNYLERAGQQQPSPRAAPSMRINLLQGVN